VNYQKPIAIRYPRGGEGKFCFNNIAKIDNTVKIDEIDSTEKIQLGKAEIIQTLLSY